MPNEDINHYSVHQNASQWRYRSVRSQAPMKFYRQQRDLRQALSVASHRVSHRQVVSLCSLYPWTYQTVPLILNIQVRDEHHHRSQTKLNQAPAILSNVRETIADRSESVDKNRHYPLSKFFGTQRE